jgi:putative ABC transport system permease protein
MRVVTAPRPELLRRNVDRDLTSMLIALAGVALIIGLVGIGNTTLVSVLERIPEFGLRRSLGATRFHNAFQVVAESTLIGGLGGLVGVLLGIIVVVAVSALQAWTPTLDPNVPPLAACVGAAVGMVAGLYPALRASSIEPDEALRR